jgi:hypothetical protein
MTARRRLLAAAAKTAAAAAAVVALTGCERPTPIVTVVSGTQSEWKEADRFCFKAGTCVEREEPLPRIELTNGGTVGIDVDKELADGAWGVVVDGLPGQQQRVQLPVQRDTHYLPLRGVSVDGDGAVLTVLQLDPEDPEGSEPLGQWSFQLVQEG